MCLRLKTELRLTKDFHFLIEEINKLMNEIKLIVFYMNV